MFSFAVLLCEVREKHLSEVGNDEQTVNHKHKRQYELEQKYQSYAFSVQHERLQMNLFHSKARV